MEWWLKQEARDFFWSRVDRRGPDDCWGWTGWCLVNGRRGVMEFKVHSWGGRLLAPRVSLAYHDGLSEIPPSAVFACHTCDNPNCVNPAHLWWGTLRENAQDCQAKGRIWRQKIRSCPQGHPYAGDNLRSVASRPGWRFCKTCKDEHWAKEQARRAKLVGEIAAIVTEHPEGITADALAAKVGDKMRAVVTRLSNAERRGLVRKVPRRGTKIGALWLPASPNA